MTRLRWTYLGEIAYRPAVARLEDRRCKLLEDDSDIGELFMCCHPPTITLGRHAQRSNIRLASDQLASRGIAVEDSSRGGDVTYHGPEQLMIYPVVRTRGLRDYVHDLADAVIATVAELGVQDCRWLDDPAGVWVGGRKIAACGLHMHKGVPIHGFALNLATPAQAWTTIVPCGLSSRPVSVLELVGEAPSPAVAAAIAGPIVAGRLTPPAAQGRWPPAAEAVWSPPRGTIERD